MGDVQGLRWQNPRGGSVHENPPDREAQRRMGVAPAPRMQHMQRHRLLRAIVLLGILLLQCFAVAQESGPTFPDLQISLPDRLKVFDELWETVRKYFFDAKFNGVNWTQMKVKYRPLAEAATNKAQLLD